jgi:hypothetical protein
MTTLFLLGPVRPVLVAGLLFGPILLEQLVRLRPSNAECIDSVRRVR